MRAALHVACRAAYPKSVVSCVACPVLHVACHMWHPGCVTCARRLACTSIAQRAHAAFCTLHANRVNVRIPCRMLHLRCTSIVHVRFAYVALRWEPHVSSRGVAEACCVWPGPAAALLHTRIRLPVILRLVVRRPLTIVGAAVCRLRTLQAMLPRHSGERMLIRACEGVPPRRMRRTRQRGRMKARGPLNPGAA